MSPQTSRRRVQEMQAQRRKKGRLQLIIGISIVAVVLAGVLILLSIPASRPAIDVERYAGLPQSVDRTGAPGVSLGDPSAPVTVVEYLDFSCPHCYELSPTIDSLAFDTGYVESGQLRIVFKPYSFLSPNSVIAGKAAICAGEQGAGWQMHDQLWTVYAPGGRAYTQQGVIAWAGGLGLDVAAFRQCMNSGQADEDIQAILTEGEALGIGGTPTVFVNGRNIPFTAAGVQTFYADLLAAVQSDLGN